MSVSPASWLTSIVKLDKLSQSVFDNDVTTVGEKSEQDINKFTDWRSICPISEVIVELKPKTPTLALLKILVKVADDEFPLVV